MTWETGGHIIADPYKCPHETKKEVFSEGFVTPFGMAEFAGRHGYIIGPRVTMNTAIDRLRLRPTGGPARSSSSGLEDRRTLWGNRG